MAAGMRFEHYKWAGGREAMLRFGPDEGPVVVIAPPLFEEANRTRALLVTTLRALADRGVAGALPDLPGQGESETPLAGIRLATWRQAFAGAVAGFGQAFTLAVRGGTLLDADAKVAGRLHVAPVTGAALVRDLLRGRRVAALAFGEPPPADDLEVPGPPLLLAGNLIDRDLLRDLTAASPIAADRTLTLYPATGPADRVLAPERLPNEHEDLPRFRAPWSASEPFVDPGLAAALAGDIAAWRGSCAAS